MQSTRIAAWKILIATVAANLMAVTAQAALDPPHTGTVGCLSCHQMTSTYPKLLPILGGTTMVNIDDSLANRACRSCHNGLGAIYMMDTHSSLKADNGYGNWTVECWVCHNQHMQEQNRYNSSTYGMYIRRSINLANITGLTKTGTKSVVFKGQTGVNSFADGDATYNGICEVCHTQTDHFQNDGISIDQLHTNVTAAAGNNCTAVCHKHTDGFIHGAGGTGCSDCHGHDNGYEGGTYSGSTQSHSTHTESDDDKIGPRPVLACNYCHNTSSFPSFRSKADANAKLSLTATDICNDCHSEGGSYNGLNDPSVGAKKNWRKGVYTGTALTTGKERWCVTCHDSGTSTIGGRQAPNVAGDNSNYGYYMSGHGAAGEECTACHDLDTLHNFDNKKTFDHASNNYQQGFRLISIDGQKPLNIPRTAGACADFTVDDYRLCLSCHDAKKLLQDTKTRGVYGCTSNPYNITNDPTVTAITTGFRNESTAGFNYDPTDTPHNIHWDHLGDVSYYLGGRFAYFDDLKSNSAKLSCPSCHNPHGAALDATTPTKRMTHPILQVNWTSDANGEHGKISSVGLIGSYCSFQCHGNDKYYRANPTISLISIAVTDNNSSDPAAAAPGYTNNLTVNVTTNYGINTPTAIMIAEDELFSINSTDWKPYSASYTYTFSTTAEEMKHVYCKVRFGTNESEIRHASIVYDKTAPSLTNSTLTSPNGGETWIQDSSHEITWMTGITDANLQESPISLHYSTDSGATYPNPITTDQINDGIYLWSVPAVESGTVTVRLLAGDKAGNQATDASDAVLTIAAVTPVLSGITSTDSNNADPAPAEAGYTNNPSVNLAISATRNPTQMLLSEDPAFADASWIPFASSTTFTLSGGDANKTVYCRVKNGAGTSGTVSSSIVLDTMAPDIQNTTLTAPNGTEFWTVSTDQVITWNAADIQDLPNNLQTNPISLEYSTDGGTTYPNPIATGEANDGSHTWRTPATANYSIRVRLTATDKAGNQAIDQGSGQVSDASDNNFYLSPPENLIVTTTSDSDDASSPWSLREAINNANALGGNQQIWFNIPATDPNFVNGTAVITIGSSLPALAATHITMDGGSQRGIRGNTNTYGPEVRIDGVNDTLIGINIGTGGHSAYIRELQLTNLGKAVSTIADYTIVEDCHMGVSSDSTGVYQPQTNAYHAYLDNSAGFQATNARIGRLGKGNYLSCANSGLWTYGIYDKGQANRIINNVIGLKPDNTLCTTPENAIYVNPTVTDNTNCEIRSNVIAGSNYGVYLDRGTGDCVIKSNLFGLTYNQGTDSWTEVGEQFYAIYLWTDYTDAGNNIIGGPVVATSDALRNDSNVINPASYGYGIYLRYSYGYTGYNMIYGNFIGTNPDEDQNFGGTTGIYIDYGNNTRVGGKTEDGQAPNVIAHMSSYGLQVARDTTDYVRISRNSFYDNGDEVDDDAIFLVAGANEAITRPVIAFANTNVVTVNNVASGDTVEVYLSDGTGTYGQGKTFINSAVASGNSVTVDISSAALSDGDWVTATRTNSNGSTSAFSLNAQLPWP